MTRFLFIACFMLIQNIFCMSFISKFMFRRRMKSLKVHREVVIVGSGPAGSTAAIYSARALLNPLQIAGYNYGGQLMLTSDVENFPGYRKAVTGPDLIDDLSHQARKFGTEIWQTDVIKVDFNKTPFELTLSNCTVTADSVIISTGASAVWLGAERELEFQGKGISSCATCDGYLFREKSVIVVGGGDSAMEEANFLSRFAKDVTIVHRSDSFKASKVS
jgi:thioredoxin reductase (NADPH)